jgi:hypothetical protein
MVDPRPSPDPAPPPDPRDPGSMPDFLIRKQADQGSNSEIDPADEQFQPDPHHRRQGGSAGRDTRSVQELPAQQSRSQIGECETAVIYNNK